MAKVLIKLFVIFIHIVLASAFSLGDQSQDRRIGIPSGSCTLPGQKIGDTIDKTMYYICIPIGDGTWIPVQQMCPVGGVFIPDQTNPACTEIIMEGSTWPPEFDSTPEEGDVGAVSPQPLKTFKAVFDLAIKGIMKLDFFSNK